MPRIHLNRYRKYYRSSQGTFSESPCLQQSEFVIQEGSSDGGVVSVDGKVGTVSGKW